MVRRQGTSAGAASRTGTPLFSPAFTSSRNTVLAASLMASPRGVKMRRVWVVTISAPVLPWRSWMSVNSNSRRSLSPMRISPSKVKVEPAYMRRGMGMRGGTVRAERSAAGVGVQETEMPARRDRLAWRRHLLVAVEGADHRLDRRRGDEVLILDLASQLLAQRLDVDGHGSSSRPRISLANRRAGSANCDAGWPQVENRPAADQRRVRRRP